MRSSTFSFSECPEGPWLRTWLLAAGLIVALLGGWECALRGLGYRPTVVDDKALWAAQRERVYSDNGEKTLVLLGDCRMQLGFVPQMLAGQFSGHRVIQLAIEQTCPVATLRDLAADERFDGVVICGLNARLLCEDLWDTQQPYVDYYHNRYTLNEKLNRLLSAAFQQRLTIIHPQLRLDDMIVHLVKTRRLPPPFYLETHADRSRLADYSGVDIQAHRQFTVGRAQWLCTGRSLPSSVKWLEDAMKLEDYVQAIHGRGGQVIFIQFPTTGDHLRYDEFMFPKAQFWDAFAARTSALCLHFQDVPQLADFACPDWSHIDRADAPRFTQELAMVLDERGLFKEPCTIACGGPGGQQCPCCDHSKAQGMHVRCTCCSVSGPL